MTAHILKDDSWLDEDEHGRLSGYIEMLCGQQFTVGPEGQFLPEGHDFYGVPTNKATCEECSRIWRIS